MASRREKNDGHDIEVIRAMTIHIAVKCKALSAKMTFKLLCMCAGGDAWYVQEIITIVRTMFD